MKKFVISLFLLICTPVYAAEICGWNVVLEVVPSDSDCPESPSDYPFVLKPGCTVNVSDTGGCISNYKVCCPDTTKSYLNSVNIKKTQILVPIGQEMDIIESLVAQAQAEVAVPICSDGYNRVIDNPGYYADIKSNSSDFTKSDIVVTAFSRVGCSKFDNNSTIVLNPLQSGGGSTVESLVELQKVNTALTTIKTVLDNIPNSTNPLLTDIKTLLQTGLNFNSEALETGINQVGVNTAAGNEILTAINNKLTQNCTTVWDPNGGVCSWYDYDRDGIPETQLCTGENVTTCEGLDVSDSASLAKLQEIKDAIIAGQGQGGSMGNYSGTVNIDLTETNGFLSDIKDFLGDIKSWSLYTPSPFVDANLTADGYKSTTGGLTGSIPSLQDYKDEFSNFATLAKQSVLAQTIEGVFGGAPTTGVSVVSFNGGVYGVHSFDFSFWSPFFSVIRGFCLILSVVTCINIIVLKGR